ncbi:hypothetical protein LguiA_004286 [Lonicera macranthoides]
MKLPPFALYYVIKMKYIYRVFLLRSNPYGLDKKLALSTLQTKATLVTKQST